MNATDLLLNVLLGGLFGILGQGIRIVIGLKKMNEQKSVAAVTGQPGDDFSSSRLLISIFIGFIAGALAMIVSCFTDNDAPKKITLQLAIGIIAGGYSGVDFIEGIFNKYIPKTTPANGQSLVVQDESKL